MGVEIFEAFGLVEPHSTRNTFLALRFLELSFNLFGLYHRF